MKADEVWWRVTSAIEGTLPLLPEAPNDWPDYAKRLRTQVVQLVEDAYKRGVRDGEKE